MSILFDEEGNFVMMRELLSAQFASDIIQDHVCLNIEGAPIFGSLAVFAFRMETRDAVVLIDEFSTLDPFIGLSSSITQDTSHVASQQALHAVNLARRYNRFFKRVLDIHLEVRNAFHIFRPATIIDACGRRYVSSL